MHKVALIMAAVLAFVASGCALVSRHTAPVEGGKKTTVGILGIDAIDNGYPMIPVYQKFEQGK